ncbi:efflux RND transporter periplasmic adaptor subunit [Alteromonas facilis]|uniref:efflux RND transporter periplasmic adaptor subunit n=1 Tax=Alteromonas facilis TaxID=2048004 RepID=UPI000C28F0DE|nr:HlyD family efflux transporter periplasmic adaptor subunit [Alteromonas facilis]
MNTRHSRHILWGVIGLTIVIAIGYSFIPTPVLTDLGRVQKGSLAVTLTDDGKTRIHDTFIVSSPVTGHLRRIDADVGDNVTLSNTVIASIEPIDPAFLDPRTEAQAKADVEAATSSQQLAQAQVNQVEAELEYALAERNRMRELRINGSVSQRDLDAAERIYKTTRAELATAQAALQMRIFELARAKAQLLSPASQPVQRSECECVSITSPIDGKVLTVITKNAGVVEAGTPLVEVGDPRQLEVVVDLLSFDAVKVQVGQPAIISNWGDAKPLHGKVTRIEPVGFKKVSALGIEEQRVNVIVGFTSDYAERERLGHGYQVDVTIVLQELHDVITLPISALFREQNAWAAYAVVNGIAEKRTVTLGQKNSADAQILSGFAEGDTYVLHPNNQISDGVNVSAIE